jgi:hypothetical protein
MTTELYTNQKAHVLNAWSLDGGAIERWFAHESAISSMDQFIDDFIAD